MSDSLDCCEETPNLALNIYTPSRGTTTTDHTGTTPQIVASFSLPVDEFSENLFVTLTGRSADGSVRVAYQMPVMVVNRQSETPSAYSVNQGSQSDMNAEDPDLTAEIVANGDTGAIIRVTHDTGSAGIFTWNFQIWTFDQLKLIP